MHKRVDLQDGRTPRDVAFMANQLHAARVLDEACGPAMSSNMSALGQDTASSYSQYTFSQDGEQQNDQAHTRLLTPRVSHWKEEESYSPFDHINTFVSMIGSTGLYSSYGTVSGWNSIYQGSSIYDETSNVVNSAYASSSIRGGAEKSGVGTSSQTQENNGKLLVSSPNVGIASTSPVPRSVGALSPPVIPMAKRRSPKASAILPPSADGVKDGSEGKERGCTPIPGNAPGRNVEERKVLFSNGSNSFTMFDSVSVTSLLRSMDEPFVRSPGSSYNRATGGKEDIKRNTLGGSGEVLASEAVGRRSPASSLRKSRGARRVVSPQQQRQQMVQTSRGRACEDYDSMSLASTDDERSRKYNDTSKGKSTISFPKSTPAAPLEMQSSPASEAHSQKIRCTPDMIQETESVVLPPSAAPLQVRMEEETPAPVRSKSASRPRPVRTYTFDDEEVQVVRKIVQEQVQEHVEESLEEHVSSSRIGSIASKKKIDPELIGSQLESATSEYANSEDVTGRKRSPKRERKHSPRRHRGTTPKKQRRDAEEEEEEENVCGKKSKGVLDLLEEKREQDIRAKSPRRRERHCEDGLPHSRSPIARRRGCAVHTQKNTLSGNVQPHHLGVPAKKVSKRRSSQSEIHQKRVRPNPTRRSRSPKVERVEYENNAEKTNANAMGSGQARGDVGPRQRGERETFLKDYTLDHLTDFENTRNPRKQGSVLASPRRKRSCSSSPMADVASARISPRHKRRPSLDGKSRSQAHRQNYSASVDGELSSKPTHTSREATAPLDVHIGRLECSGDLEGSKEGKKRKEEIKTDIPEKQDGSEHHRVLTTHEVADWNSETNLYAEDLVTSHRGLGCEGNISSEEEEEIFDEDFDEDLLLIEDQSYVRCRLESISALVDFKKRFQHSGGDSGEESGVMGLNAEVALYDSPSRVDSPHHTPFGSNTPTHAEDNHSTCLSDAVTVAVQTSLENAEKSLREFEREVDLADAEREVQEDDDENEFGLKDDSSTTPLRKRAVTSPNKLLKKAVANDQSGSAIAVMVGNATRNTVADSYNDASPATSTTSSPSTPRSISELLTPRERRDSDKEGRGNIQTNLPRERPLSKRESRNYFYSGEWKVRMDSATDVFSLLIDQSMVVGDGAIDTYACSNVTTMQDSEITTTKTSSKNTFITIYLKKSSRVPLIYIYIYI